MDVTRDNFRETLPAVKEAINNSSFICIDGEFTGLSNGSYNLTAYDSPSDRYCKLHCNTEDFILLQFGMCTFSWNKDSQTYNTEAFNFYIFPFRSSIPGVPDRIFSCQSSSLDFLTLQGFDFNKAFRSGIPFLRKTEESSVRLAIKEKQAFRENRSPGKGAFHYQKNSALFQSPIAKGSPTLITDQKTKDFVGSVIKQVQTFLDEETSNELVLDSCNSYLRKILYETLPSAFPEKIMLEGKIDDKTRQRCIAVVRGASESVKQAREQQIRKKEEHDLHDAIGFSEVIKLLSESQKLIVGHNMLLDIFYTIQQFVCPLPDCLEEFKSLVCCLFPKILDTKLMGSMLPFKDILLSTALGEMNTRLREPPFTPPILEVPGKYNTGTSETQSDNLHEAAYDAFITGSAFLSMVQHLFSLQKSSKVSTTPTFTSLMNLVSPYVNKVYLMRCHDIPYLNLAGIDLTPNREHVFHVEFPSSWKMNDLRQLFSPLGQINVSWIKDTSCFVGLYNKGQAKHVMTLMESDGAEPRDFRILNYDDYKTANPIALFSSRPFNRVIRGSSIASPLSAANPSLACISQATNSWSDIPDANEVDRPCRKRSSKVDNDNATRPVNSCDQPEPAIKRQKSREECTVVSENCKGAILKRPLLENDNNADEELLPLSPSISEDAKPKSISNAKSCIFEVPGEW